MLTVGGQNSFDFNIYAPIYIGALFLPHIYNWDLDSEVRMYLYQKIGIWVDNVHFP